MVRRALALTVAVLAAASTSAHAGSSAPCGSAAAATLGAVDAAVLDHVHANEQNGTEVSADLAHVRSAGDLLAALAAHDAHAVTAAVTRLVLHPHWHIVRLRVLDSHGRVVADVGGRYVIAPVGGTLRSGSTTLGSFQMSVQDDIGVAKLESRFVGDPIGMYVGGRLVASLGAAFPASTPTAGTLGSDLVVTRAYGSFPSGTLTAVLLVAPPSLSLAHESCAALRAGEFARVAGRFAALAHSLASNWYGYAATVHLYSGALVFVRDGGRQLGSSSGAGPATIPASGTVVYGGATWLVASLAPRPPTRVYVLVAPASTSSTAAPSKRPARRSSSARGASVSG
jgi:hypothetical protein